MNSAKLNFVPRDYSKFSFFLMHRDNNTTGEVRSRLEEVNAIIHTFGNANDVLFAISNKSKDFHVIIAVNFVYSD